MPASDWEGAVAIQTRLPLVPPEAVEVNDTVCFVHDGDRIGYFAAGVPLFSHASDDATGRRVAAAQILALGLAKQSELSAALGVNRTTSIGSSGGSRPTASAGWLTRSAGRRGLTS